MSLQPGTHLGPYEILAQIGAGGMGEVYKARDPRLNRIVAIKTLPAHLAERAELRERFKREAETIANLKHPNICVLYDIGYQQLPLEDIASASDVASRQAGASGAPGPSQGVHYLVMEYLEGETLAHRLLKGPLPLDQVLKYAIEISDALDKAHRSGATHRDIKPGNIMLTKEGSKLLDFGLAKLKQDAAQPNIALSQLPTGQGPLTQDGTILGTLQYMAPEQVEGKVDEIDARTDIFAFGAVVYEMATGKKCFEGQSAASTIAKILEHSPPPISSLQPPGNMSLPPSTASSRSASPKTPTFAGNRLPTSAVSCSGSKKAAHKPESPHLSSPAVGPASGSRGLQRRWRLLLCSARWRCSYHAIARLPARDPASAFHFHRRRTRTFSAGRRQLPCLPFHPMA
jgi:serine/threonine protein kinase